MSVYLFDAQNRWGYEKKTEAVASVARLYLFDAQNRWGYEKQNLQPEKYLFCVSIRCSESLGL